MHKSVLDWAARVATLDMIGGKAVLEVGAADVNGSVRPTIAALRPALYRGIDLVPGLGVDLVSSAEQHYDYVGDSAYDVVVSCEMLEHAADWRAAFSAMCAMAAETLILTCRGPGFFYHNPPDYWRFTLGDLMLATTICGFRVKQCIPDPQVPGVFLLATRTAWPTPQRAPRPEGK